MKATRTRQRGQSLISMMIGLVISLITIAAMLTLVSALQYLRAAWPSLREDEKAARGDAVKK